MSRFTRLVALATLGIGCASAVLADDLEGVQKKISAAWEKQKSMTAKVTLATHMEMGTMVIDGSGEGTIEFMRQADKIYSRNDIKSTTTQKMGDKDQKTEQSMLNIIDGEYMYSLTEMAGQKSANKSKIDAKMAGEPKAMFEELGKEYDFKLLPDEEVNGAKTYVIEANPKQKNPMGGGRMVLNFLQDSGFVVKLAIFGEAEKPITTITYSDLKMDVKIDPDHFKFKAPEGVEVVDQTQVAAPGSAPASAPAKPAKPE
jgi:outer membrane lipoprotein-sorting protein